MFLISQWVVIVNCIIFTIAIAWPNTLHPYLSLNPTTTRLISCVNDITSSEYFCISYNTATNAYELNLIYHSSNNRETLSTQITNNNFTTLNYFFKTADTNTYYLFSEHTTSFFKVTTTPTNNNILITEDTSQGTNFPSEYFIIPFYIPDTNLFLAIVHNTSNVYTYYTDTNSWKTGTESPIGGNAQVAMVSVKYTQPTHIYSLNVENNRYYLCRIIYDGGTNWSPRFQIKPSFNLYTKSLIGLNNKNVHLDNKDVYVFTYEPRSHAYRYYHISINKQKIIYYGETDQLHEVFNSAIQIVKANLYDNTQYLYYLTQKINTTTMYIGVVDLEYAIQLYNIEIDLTLYNTNTTNVDVGSFNNTQSPQDVNNAFIYVLIDNTQYMLCPFVYDSVNKRCQIVINSNSNQYISISKINGNSLVTECSYGFVLGEKYCIEKCPFGFAENVSTRTCDKCDGYYSVSKRECSSDCSSGKYDLNKYCNDCENEGLMFYKNICVDSCESIYSEYIEESNSCYNCKEHNKHFYINKCVDACPIGTIEDVIHNECISCKAQSKYYLNGTCVDNCNDNQLYYDDTYVCYTCDEKDEAFPYKQGDQCVDKCSEGFSTNEERFKCIYCKEFNMFYYNDKCYSECSFGYLYDNDNICYTCKDKFPSTTPYIQDNECVDKCSRGYEINEEYKLCTSCKSLHQFLNHKFKCADTCEEYSLYDEYNVCYFCNETSLTYYQDGSCVERCSLGHEVNTELSTCINCKRNDLYYVYSQHKCLNETSCEEHSLKDEDNFICYLCKDMYPSKPWIFNNDCVEVCPESTEQINENNYCRYCLLENKYVEDKKCVDTCSEYKIINETDHRCLRCIDSPEFGGIYFDIEENKCVMKCKEGHTESLTDYACVSCKLRNEFYQDGSCHQLCHSNSYADNATHICYNCYCSDRGECSHNTSQCTCDMNSTGYNCEMVRKNTTYEGINIVSLNSNHQIRKSLINCFGYTLNEDIVDDDTEYKIKCDVQIEGTRLYKDNYFYNGYNEHMFCVPPNTFALGNESNVISIDYYDTKYDKHYVDSVNITVERFVDEYLDSKRFLMLVQFDKKVKYIPMETLVFINITDATPYKDKLMFALSIVDKYGEDIPLTAASVNKEYVLTLPYATMIKLTIINDRKEVIVKNYTNNEDIVEAPQNYTSDIIKDIIHTDKLCITNTTKLFLLQKHFLYSTQYINEYEVKQTLLFIKERFDDIMKNDNVSYKEHISQYAQYGNQSCMFDYYEQRTVYSIINYIAHFGYKENETSFLNDVSDLLMHITQTLNDDNTHIVIIDETYLSDVFSIQMKSLFRTIDTVIGQSLLISGDEYYNVINRKLNYVIRNYTQCISRHTLHNQDMQLIGQYVVIQVVRFGREQTQLYINQTHFRNKEGTVQYDDYIYNDRSISFKSYDNNSYTYTTESYFLKVKEEDYLRIANAIVNDSDSNDNIRNYCINVIQLPQSKGLVTVNSNDNNSSSRLVTLISLYNPSTNTISDKISELIIETSFPQDNIITPYNTINISCIPDNTYNITPTKWCKTHFNYIKQNVICTCKNAETISYINNSTYTSKAKQFQFAEINANHNNNNNTFGLIIIYTSFFIIVTPTFMYLIRDHIHSNTKPQIKRKDYFNKLRCLFNANKVKLAWYYTLMKLPFFECFTIQPGSYNNIQFAKYYIRITLTFFTLILSSIPYITFITNSEREVFIDKRDYFIDDTMVNDLPLSFVQFIRGICFAIVASMLMKIVLVVIQLFISEINVMNEYWSPVKKMFKEYVNDDIKKEVLLGNKWTKIRKRFILFNKLCGQYMLNKQQMKHKTTLDKYIEYKYPNKVIHVVGDKSMTLFPEDLNSNNNNNNTTHELLIPQGSIEHKETTNQSDRYEGVIQTNIISFNNQTGHNELFYNSCSINDNDNNNIKNDLYNKNEISFTISKHITKPLHYKKIQKIESIHYRYMFQSISGIKIHSLLSESELDSNSKSNMSISFTKQLEVCYEYNYTYLSRNIYPSTSPLDISPQLQKQKTIVNRIFIVLTFLFMLLIVTYGFILMKFKTLYSNYGKLIIKCWLIPSLIQVMIINFICLFIWNFIISYAMFNWRTLKKVNCVVGLFFTLFVDKYQTSLFKIRNYITKYHNQFNYIDS